MVCDTSVYSLSTQHAMMQLSEKEIPFELIEVSTLSTWPVLLSNTALPLLPPPFTLPPPSTLPPQALLTYFKTLSIPGAVLIFLPGWNSIFALHRHLSAHPMFGGWRSPLALPACQLITPLLLLSSSSPPLLLPSFSSPPPLLLLSSSSPPPPLLSFSPPLLLFPHRLTGVRSASLSLADPSRGPEKSVCSCS